MQFRRRAQTLPPTPAAPKPRRRRPGRPNLYDRRLVLVGGHSVAFVHLKIEYKETSRGGLAVNVIEY